MSKIIYLIGAGASRGKRNESISGLNKYSSGMPIVSEMSDYLGRYCQTFVSPIGISVNGHISQHRSNYPRVHEELKWLLQVSKENPTLDTYAKKLFTRGPYEELARLKRAMAMWFTLIQSKEKRDMRYDSFMGAVVDNRGKMNSQISILSWNYDKQCEYAFHEYELNRTGTNHQFMYANISCKGFTSQYINTEDSNLVKLNGMAAFKPTHDHLLFEDSEYSLSYFEQMLTRDSINVENLISYAWEEDDRFIEKILPLTEDTETLIIIGYSLPRVNQSIDSRLINNMKNLKSIVIQDTDHQTVRTRLNDIIPDEKKELMNHITVLDNVSEFYVPKLESAI